jgi:hypothetical protein
MLWYKGWLESRFRLLFSLGFFCILLIQAYVLSGAKTPDGGKVEIARVFVISEIFLVATLCSMVSGAGIATQASLQGSKGLHGSTLFTLSLPVSRFRLLAVRAALGWLEMAGGIGAMCAGMWILLRVMKTPATPQDMFRYAIALIACASGLYFLSVLLATFLEEQWRMSGNMISFAALWWIPNHTGFPVSANIIRAMGEGSPLLAHTMPWIAMALSLELAAILFFAAIKIVQLREY